MKQASITSTLLCLCVCTLVASCGGGGSDGGSDTVATPLMTLETVNVTGNAAWPGATSLTVKIDGSSPIAVTDGTWATAINMHGRTTRTATVELIADSVIVAAREITVSK